MEYVTPLAPAFTEDDPLIGPATPTGLTVTVKKLLEVAPQLPFEGKTATLPEIAEHE